MICTVGLYQPGYLSRDNNMAMNTKAPYGANNPVFQAGQHGKYQEALRRLARGVDKAKDTGGILGGIGVAGNIASLALAPFTGGASLAAGPLLTAGAQMGAGALLPGVDEKAQKAVEKARADIQMAHPFSQAPGLGATAYAAGAGGGEQALAQASKGYEAAQEVADILDTTSKVLSGINTAVSLGSSALTSAAAEQGVAEAAKAGSKEAAKKVATEGTAQAGTKMAEAAAKGATQIQGAMPAEIATTAAEEAAGKAVTGMERLADTGAYVPGIGAPAAAPAPAPATAGFSAPSTPAEFVEMFKGGPTATASDLKSQLLGGPIGAAPPHPGMGAALGVQPPPPPVVPTPSIAPNFIDMAPPLGGGQPTPFGSPYADVPLTDFGTPTPSPTFAYHDPAVGSAVLGTPSGFSQTSRLLPSEASTRLGTNVPSSLPIEGMAGQTPGWIDYADKFVGDVQQAMPFWRRIHSAAQGLAPASPAYTSFMGGARDIGSDIPFLRRFLTR